MSEQVTLRQIVDDAARAAISSALAQFSGNVARTARHLDIDRRSLYRMMDRLAISLGEMKWPRGKPRLPRPDPLRVCLDPDKMHGAGDGFGGSDVP